eukprot:2431864-Lingulodinium_polyedra.AAC.1
MGLPGGQGLRWILELHRRDALAGRGRPASSGRALLGRAGGFLRRFRRGLMPPSQDGSPETPTAAALAR